jgi:hypothetical protein
MAMSRRKHDRNGKPTKGIVPYQSTRRHSSKYANDSSQMSNARNGRRFLATNQFRLYYPRLKMISMDFIIIDALSFNTRILDQCLVY